MRPPRRRLLLAVLAATLLLAATASAPVAADGAAGSDLVLILDASGSMWGQIGGEAKIVIARRALGELLAGGAAADGELGLVTYGHRREGDCSDIETVFPIGAHETEAVRARIEAITPRGKTPITAAVQQALTLLDGRDRPATLILVSDGLETCGGDPCAAVRSARQSGAAFLLHVVGFDLGEGDVSQLECAAQAGGGLFFDADDGDQLAAALEQAVAAPVDAPAGALSVAARADGSPIDALVEVRPAGADPAAEPVAAGRTYLGADTNPRIFYLPDGSYDLTVQPVAISGAPELSFDGVAVAEGSTAERVADFSSGELAIRATRNGDLSDATVRVTVAGSGGRTVASGRTYTKPESNPRIFELAAGSYDVEVASVEISGKPVQRFEGILVAGGERASREHDFPAGDLEVTATIGGSPVDALVQVSPDGGDGRQVAGGRTYGRKAVSATLTPGRYRVRVAAVKAEGRPEKELTVEIEAGGTVSREVDLGG